MALNMSLLHFYYKLHYRPTDEVWGFGHFWGSWGVWGFWGGERYFLHQKTSEIIFPHLGAI